MENGIVTGIAKEKPVQTANVNPTEKKSPESIEKVVSDRIEPIVEEAMRESLGITISELKKDISDQIKKNPMIDFTVEPSMKFKKAKDLFKKEYLTKVLRQHFGNISAAAKTAGLDRRSLHRLIHKLKIPIASYREVLLRASYIREMAVSSIIEKCLQPYKEVLNPDKLGKMYKSAPTLSKNIAKELPDVTLNMAEAEILWEKRYFSQVLLYYSGSTGDIAKKIGLRYETLHRKLREIGINEK